MYKGLYDNFKHWFHDNRGQVYFYSDPHFNDAEMIYLRASISDDEQIKSINSRIGKYDTLVILGDVGDISSIPFLRGYKVLIMGNHDKGASNYLNHNNIHLFDEVYEGPLTIAKNIILSHEPIDCPYMLNIHGHDHANWHGNDSHHLNVCAEHINYTPIGLKQIIESGRLNKIDDIHRATIDQATEKSRRKKGNDVNI